MIDALLSHIKTNILTLNPATFIKGYSGARQYQDGKIVIYDNYEGEYVGLQDTKNNYFYIRYLNELELDAASDQRGTSCFELTGQAPVRLVAWVYKGVLGKLAEVLIQDIQSTDFTTLSATDKERFSGIKIFYSGLVTDPEQIYKDEVVAEDNQVKLAKGVTLLAVDFGITFNYKAKKSDCIDRDICSGCA